MDKLTKIDRRIATQNGFALLLTLSVLVIVMSLSAILVRYISFVKKDANSIEALIQADILYVDMQNSVKKFANNREDFYKTLYSSTIPIDTDSNISILLKCKPLSSRVNINWIKYEANSAKQTQYNSVVKTLSYIAQTYEILDIELLEDMIKAYLIQGDESNSGFKNRLVAKNEILSQMEFEDIIYRYLKLENDTNIIKVPWNRYFDYNSLDIGDKIEPNYISFELITVLYDIDIETTQNEWVEGDDLKSFVQKYGKTFDNKLFYKKLKLNSICEVYYNYKQDRYRFSYIDIEGEVKNFEFYGKE
jgi:Tfp pilus assembly protein PilV